MSRLIVKGLGKTTTEAKLKEVFETKGTVTDVKVIKTKDGRSRRFAFIGFKSEEAAAAAKAYFNNSFIGTTRISVQPALRYYS
jgi:multiple RNA-binding domain-containing protein 1